MLFLTEVEIPCTMYEAKCGLYKKSAFLIKDNLIYLQYN